MSLGEIVDGCFIFAYSGVAVKNLAFRVSSRCEFWPRCVDACVLRWALGRGLGPSMAKECLSVQAFKLGMAVSDTIFKSLPGE